MMTEFYHRHRHTLSIIAVLASAFLLGAAVFLMHSRIPPERLKNILASAEPLMLWFNLLMLALFIWRSRDSIKSFLGTISKEHLKILGLIFLVALLVRVLLTPDTHRLYYDEDIYLSTAHNMAHQCKAVGTDFGTFRWDDYTCRRWFLNKQPNGLPALMSIVFFLFGVSERYASILIIILSALSPLLLFFLARMLFNDRAALWSALVASLIPLSVIWAKVPSAETATCFFMLLTMVLVMLYCRHGGTDLLGAFLFSLAYTVQFRPEGILFIPVACLPLLTVYRRLAEDFCRKRVLLLWVLALLILSLHALHLLYFAHEPWGVKEGGKFGLQYFSKNIRDNAAFFIVNREFPVFFSLAALIGLCAGEKRKVREKLPLMLWFVLFFVIYIFFYAGSYRYGVDVRFAIHILPPLAIFAGLGFEWLADRLYARFRDPMVSRYLAVFVLFIFITFIPYITTVHEESWQARWDHDFIIREANKLPQDAIIFMHSPYIVVMNCKRGGAQTFLGMEDDMVDLAFQCTDNVYYYHDYWSYDPELVAHFHYYVKHFEMTPVVREKMYDREYIIYKIRRK